MTTRQVQLPGTGFVNMAGVNNSEQLPFSVVAGGATTGGNAGPISNTIYINETNPRPQIYLGTTATYSHGWAPE